VFGKKKGFDRPEIIEALEKLRSDYEHLIFDYALNPAILDSLEDRIRHAGTAGREPENFIQEELRAFREIKSAAEEKERQSARQAEARRRQMAGETFADKVLDEYRQRIQHYPMIEVHPDADPEVCRLYGAVSMLDKRYWETIESYLRKAFPQAGQIDRMNIEQRFWRYVSTREGRLPDDLEKYRRIISSVSASKQEKIREAQEAIKSVAFYLHDLLDLCEMAASNIPHDEEIKKAMDFVRGIITDFRLKDIRKRK